MEQYVTEMLRCMRDVNVDNNTVGWYMSTYMNSWLDPEGPTVATQFQ
jgi:translation initiation factor 3 subunit H